MQPPSSLVGCTNAFFPSLIWFSHAQKTEDDKYLLITVYGSTTTVINILFILSKSPGLTNSISWLLEQSLDYVSFSFIEYASIDWLISVY